MILAIFLILSWAVVCLHLNYPRTLSRNENIFLFLVILNINISVSWIVGYELEKMTFPETPVEYFAYLLHRSLFIPLIPVIFTNWLYHFRSRLVRVLLLLGYGFCFARLEKLCLHYDVFTFTDWNLRSSLIMYYIYLALAVCLLKWFRAAFNKNAEEAIQ